MKSFYEKILVREEHVFPCNAIWTLKLSIKVYFFSWLATIGVILTAKNLRKRKVVCHSWCYMWKEVYRDVDHLLLHCRLTMRLWWDKLRWFVAPWGMMFSWKSGKRKRRLRAWNVVPLALMWVNWRERKKRAFEGVELSFSPSKSSLRSLIFFWCTQKVPSCIDNWWSL